MEKAPNWPLCRRILESFHYARSCSDNADAGATGAASCRSGDSQSEVQRCERRNLMAFVLFMNRTNAEHMVHVAGSAARIRMCFSSTFV